MRHITPTALAGTMPAPSTTTSGPCDCMATQQDVYDTVGEYATGAMTSIGNIKDALSTAAEVTWSGPAGSGFHDAVSRLVPTAEAYCDDIAGISRLCG